MDSTGVCVLSEKKNKVKRQVHKVKGDPVGFLMSERADQVLNKTNNVFAILGHARAATIGAVNETNAHPIEERHITGCHNGTVHRFAPPKANEEFETDSRILYRKIASEGLEPTLKEAGEYGAYALTWANFSNMTVNFIRNDKRPLWFMFNKSKTTIYWASERGMLSLVADRNGGSDSFADPFQLTTDTLWSFKMGKVDPHIQKLDLKKTFATVSRPPWHNSSHSVNSSGKSIAEQAIDRVIKESKTPPGPSMPVVSAITKPGCDTCDEEAGGYDFADREQYDQWKGKEESSQEGTNPFAGFYRGFNDTHLPIAEAVTYLEHGCCECGQDLDIGETSWWVSWKDLVCNDCIDGYSERLVSLSQIWKGELIA